MLQDKQGKYVYAYAPFCQGGKRFLEFPQQIFAHTLDEMMNGVQERMCITGDLVEEYEKPPLCSATETITQQ